MELRAYLVAHYFNRSSELWLARIRDAMQQYICGDAYFDTSGSTSSNTLSLMRQWWSLVRKTRLTDDFIFAPPRRRALVSSVRGARANLVYCHYVNLATRLDSCWRSLRTPLAVHCHGYDVTFDLKNAKGRRRYSDGYLQRVVRLSQYSHMIANSDFTRHRLIEHGIAEDRVTTWYFGVPITRTATRVSTDLVHFLYLGRFVGFKGPIETLRAFALAVSRGLRARLVMAGGGTLFNECRNLAIRLRVDHLVDFPGVVSAAQGAKLFGESHVFTAHTRQDPVTNQCEAFGVAFAEALGAGLPVVTGRHAGPSTFLSHEHNSLLFPPGDIDAHAESLMRIANDSELRSQLSQNAIATAAMRFDPDKQHAILIDLLSRIARAG
ncbi:glycosyltransferase family 4 protein [Stieleria varia]|uniref:UDP-D-galactose:(Glucosyl)lipopolysaccharide-1, 6-D-galactosyltransferase n=1 Tax=Stieleria varia TaxID=2528005 RepID=A0A5C6A0G7_9BACT|nr:glycosyltransferase family 4 protein [Stieleria varia]TWT92807.1 UDP-D-galactose:(glucosyl)lipopolysaccharide-1,6-D-galactosyltransferase [Stieleria varia]